MYWGLGWGVVLKCTGGCGIGGGGPSTHTAHLNRPSRNTIIYFPLSAAHCLTIILSNLTRNFSLPGSGVEQNVTDQLINTDIR